jgi:hypothetical protein
MPESKEQSSPRVDVEAELSKLRAEVKSMRAALPTTMTPLHGAGPGMDVDETWCLAEQEAARAEMG